MFVLTYACLVSSSPVPRMLFKKQVIPSQDLPQKELRLWEAAQNGRQTGFVDGHLIGHEEIQDLDG